jgi:hypothetical protein
MTTAKNGRATLYKGTRMRSRLEADYAAYLDDMEQSWEYEPICFASGSTQWLPDFGLVHPRFAGVAALYRSQARADAQMAPWGSQ